MTALRNFLGARWSRLAVREKTGLRIAAATVGVLLLWLFLLAPALKTLNSAEAQHLTLDEQLKKMQRLKATALALQAQPQLSRDARVLALERTLKSLGPGAQLQVSGTQITITLRQVPAEVLADWLVQSRTQARMQANEVRLTRNKATPAAGWDGTLVYRLPVV